MINKILLKNSLWNLTDEIEYNIPDRFEHRLKLIDNILLRRACGDVLEVGCGDGRFLKKLNFVDRVNSIWGVDISMEAVTKAYEKGFRVIRAKAENLPFKDEIFDTVMRAKDGPGGMDWELLLSEVYKVLKPGGIFAFDGYNKYPLKKIIKYKIMRFLKTTDKPFESINGGVENVRDFKKSCSKFGFKIISLYTVLSVRFLPCEILLKGEMFSQIDTHFVGVLKK